MFGHVNRLATALIIGLGLLGLVMLLLRGTAMSHAAGIHCVVPPGHATGPYAACDQIYTSLQSAVDAASSGTEIRVAQGIYTDVHEYAGVIQVAFISRSITIRGGYLPPFDNPPQPAVYTTTLDAQSWGRPLYVTGNISVTIEGLHLTGGWPRFTLEDNSGGGLYVADATLVLKDTVIEGNRGAAGDSRGGGIYLTAAHASSPVTASAAA